MQRCRESRKTKREGRGGGAIAAVSADLGGEDPIRRQQKKTLGLFLYNSFAVPRRVGYYSWYAFPIYFNLYVQFCTYANRGHNKQS
jgi:hypothetical protein